MISSLVCLLLGYLSSESGWVGLGWFYWYMYTYIPQYRHNPPVHPLVAEYGSNSESERALELP